MTRSASVRALAVALLLVPAALAARSGGGVHVSVNAPALRAIAVALTVPLATAILAAAVLTIPAVLPYARRRRRSASALRGLFPFLATLGLLAGLAAIGVKIGGSLGGHHASRGLSFSRGLPAGGPTSPAPFPWWPAAATAALLAAAAGAAYVVRRRRRRSARAARSGRGSAAVAAPAPPGPLPDDPRAAVIEAYLRMESALAGDGHVRLDGEPPRRFSRRIAELLPGHAPAVAELTGLVETAAFSTHPVGGSERRRAVAALAAIESARETPA